MFEAISKAITEVQKQDEEKLQKRKSKRLSRSSTHISDSEENSEFEVPETVAKEEDLNSVSDIEEDEEELIADRLKWENDYIVVVHMIAFAVGGSNIWRFGFLCSTHGGIAFMIPYLILTFICGYPIVYLELLIGQYAQVGTVACWKLAPIFKGVGMSMTLLAFINIFDMQSMMAWCLFYMFQSVAHHPLPWISCDNGFGKKKNGQEDPAIVHWKEEDDESKNWHTENCTDFFADSEGDGSFGENKRLPGSEFFRGRVQRMWKSGFADRESDPGFKEDNGKIVFGLNEGEEGILPYNLDTLVALIFVFVIIGLCIIRGVKAHAKMMLVLTIAPYVWLVLLFYRATGLSGAWSGLAELLKPDISKLSDFKTWRTCMEHILYSTGGGYGVHLIMASHNPFSRRLISDVTTTLIVNGATSIVSAFTIFMFLGHVKDTLNKDIKPFVKDGPKLIFEVMSDVLGVLPKASFYAFSFYLMAFLVVLTTVTTSLICTKSAYVEVLPAIIKYRVGVRIMVMFLLYVISFLTSMLNLTRGGLHVYKFMQTFSGATSLIPTVFFFLIGVSWCFGLRELIEATTAMNIRAPGMYFQICWKFITPICLIALMVSRCLDPDTLKVVFEDEEIVLGTGLQIIGYLIAVGPGVLILLAAIHTFWTSPGKNFKQKLLTSISPTREHTEILDTGTAKRAKFSHYFYLYATTPGIKWNILCAFPGGNQVAPEIIITEYEHGEKEKDHHEKEKHESQEDYTNFTLLNEIMTSVPATNV